MSGVLINEEQLAAFALDTTTAEDAYSASVERLVQSIIKVALRRSAHLNLDGVATLGAFLECTARITLSLPGGASDVFGRRLGDQLACVIAARAGGHVPGMLDVPITSRQQ